MKRYLKQFCYSALIIVFGFVCYRVGKHVADKYYAAQMKKVAPATLDRALELAATLQDSTHGVEMKMCGDQITLIVRVPRWTGTELDLVEDEIWYCKEFGCFGVAHGAIVGFGDNWQGATESHGRVKQ